mgnify:FL=1|tara:strand:+ start:2105 stop:3733 length:1629 start_codon:yes stop_codon:yes gene_type:complete
MSYSNPQRIRNKEFDALEKMTNTFDQTSQGIFNIVKTQKEYDQKLQESNIDKESKLRDKINEFTKPGAGQLDNNVVKFWDEKVANYVDNLNLAANGEITQREAMLRNKQIEGLIPMFKENANMLYENASSLQDAIDNGTLSSTGSVASKEVLNRLNNNGYVDIIEKDGAIYYWAPELNEDGQPIEGSGVMLNGSEMYANADKALFNNKADVSGVLSTGWNKFSGEESGISDYVKTIAVKNGDKHPITGEVISGLEDGYEQVIRVPVTDAKNDFIAEVEASAYLNPVLGNEKEMLSVWQDVIPDGEPDENGEYPPNTLGFFASGGDPNLEIDLDAMGLTMEQWQNSVYGEYPDDLEPEQIAAIDKAQKDVAKRWMSNSMWDENSISAGASKTIGKRKIPPPPSSSTTGSDSGESLKFTTDTGKEYSQAATNSIRAGIKMEEEVDEKMRKASVGNKDAQQAALIGLVTSYGFAEKDFEDEIEALDFDAITQGLKEDLFKDIGQGATSYQEYQVGKQDYNSYLDKKKGSKVKNKGTGFNPNSYKN